MKYSEIIQKEKEELKSLIEETQDKIRSIRFEIVTKSFRENSQYGQAKRLLARLKTAYRQKESK